MTTQEMLERARLRLRSSSDIPEMDEKEAQLLMAMPSATFIRKKQPESGSKELPTTPKNDTKL